MTKCDLCNRDADDRVAIGRLAIYEDETLMNWCLYHHEADETDLDRYDRDEDHGEATYTVTGYVGSRGTEEEIKALNSAEAREIYMGRHPDAELTFLLNQAGA